MLSGTRTAPSTILIVDDDTDLREALGSLIAQEGFTVTMAVNGADALERLSQLEPALILLDWSMPVMDGAEFRDEQKRRPRLAGIPTVLMSATEWVAERAAGSGVAGFLRKPIDIEQLFALVRRYCHPAA